VRMLARQIRLETKLFVRDKDGFFWTLAFPILFLVFFGLIYRDVVWDDVRPMEYLLPAIIMMAVIITGITHNVNTFIEEREKGIYRRLFLTPLKGHTILGGQLIHRYLLILVQAVILLIIGVLAYDIRISGSLLLLWLVVTLGGMCLLSIGFALTTFIRSSRASNAITMVVLFVLLFLSGLFVSTEMLPDFLGTISSGLPSTHLNDAIRAIVVQGDGMGAIWQSLLVFGIWGGVCLVIAVRFFRWE